MQKEYSRGGGGIDPVRGRAWEAAARRERETNGRRRRGPPPATPFIAERDFSPKPTFRWTRGGINFSDEVLALENFHHHKIN